MKKLLQLSAPTIVLLLVAMLPTSLFSQFSQVTAENGTIVKIHRFEPLVPAKAANATAPTKEAASSGELSESAVQQINALLEEKQSRTATQLKISSRLLYTARMLQGQAAAPGVPVLFTKLELDEQNNLFVDITARVSDDLLQRLRSLGARIVRSDPTYRSIRAFVSSYQLEAIAAFPEVIFISPRRDFMTVGAGADGMGKFRRPVSSNFAQRAARVREGLKARLAGGVTGAGSVTSEGDATHRAAEARATFGVSGAGVKIGVLSNGVDSLATSQASGDLGSVTVLPGQGGSGDEGTAMLEIIHDLAPGAELFFATADNGIESFAQNIRELRGAGCDIIVDDVIYFAESPFHDGQAPSVVSNHNGGVATQAVNDMVADGAIYFSSAGNDGNKDDGFSGTYEGDFVDGGSNAKLPGGKVNKFGANAYDTIFFSFSPIVLYWADPLGGSKNDYDLFVLNSTGTVVVDASTDPQTGTQDPAEGVGPTGDGFRVVVFKATAAANRFFHLDTFGAELELGTTGAVNGHAGATGALAVAATPAAAAAGQGFPTGPFPNPFDATDVVEPFSSDGPRRIFFHADGTAITPGNFSSTGGTALPKPEFTAADGVSITGAGGFPNPFFGTSAAAPHGAAIAALVKSFDLTQTNTEVAGFMTSTAIDIMGAGVDRDSGAGVVMAFEALQAASVPQLTSLTPVSGDVGTNVTIAGKNFGPAQGTSSVTFNGIVALPTTWNDTTIHAKVPAGANTGNVVVTVLGQASNSLLFTFTPKITGLSTNSAPPGAAVTITGANFGATQGTSTLTFNGKVATVTSWSATSIVANVPAGATTGNVVVTINGVASNGSAFTVQDFSVPAALTDITVTAGQSSQAQHFNVTPGTAFDAAITFSCTGLPSKATCTFTPPSATPGGGPVDVAMVVSTKATTTSGAASALFGTWLSFGGLGLVLMMGAGSRKRNRKAPSALGLFLLVPLVLAIASCGGGGSSMTTTIPGTPRGTTTITMNATAGSTVHSSTFKLTVQ